MVAAINSFLLIKTGGMISHTALRYSVSITYHSVGSSALVSFSRSVSLSGSVSSSGSLSPSGSFSSFSSLSPSSSFSSFGSLSPSGSLSTSGSLSSLVRFPFPAQCFLPVEFLLFPILRLSVRILQADLCFAIRPLPFQCFFYNLN